jgi:peptidoglycan/xylan/chitin deacetylase (PgdA/CDA1 family)
MRTAVRAAGSRADELLPRWRSRLTGGLTVFMFHDVTASPSPFQRASGMFTSPGVFRQQLAWIGERFTPIAPSELRRLGGSGELPTNAALVTFDDAWAGVFRTAIPILVEQGIPCLCFLNMGTVAGDPDLAVVRRYEQRLPAERRLLAGRIDEPGAAAILDEIRERYVSDPQFTAYQGPTATRGDLLTAAALGSAWFGSHLYHHWDLQSITGDLLARSLADNRDALAAFPNTVPAFATPNGAVGESIEATVARAEAAGARVVFVGTSEQNHSADSPVINRLTFPTEPCGRREWWYATHRRRALGIDAR